MMKHNHHQAFSHTHCIPSNIIRTITEVVPRKVMQMPCVEINEEKMSNRRIHALNKTIKAAWCLARLQGYSFIHVERTTGEMFVSQFYHNHGWVDDRDEVEFNTNLQAYVRTQPRSVGIESQLEREKHLIDQGDWVEVYRFLPAVDFEYYDNILQPSLIDNWCNGYRNYMPIINREVECAVELYQEAVKRLYLRLKNGNTTMLEISSLADDPKRKETMDFLAKKLELENKIIAPGGSKFTSQGISLDNFDVILEPFWLNIFRAAGIPDWMVGAELSNSQYPLESQALDLQELWYEHAYPAFIAILSAWVPPDLIEVEVPTYRDAENSLAAELREADIENRMAVVRRLDAQSAGLLLDNEGKQMAIDNPELATQSEAPSTPVSEEGTSSEDQQ